MSNGLELGSDGSSTSDPLAEQIARALEEDIVLGRLRPGQKLREEELRKGSRALGIKCAKPWLASDEWALSQRSEIAGSRCVASPSTRCGRSTRFEKFFNDKLRFAFGFRSMRYANRPPRNS